jgi:hypothetical protein
MIDWKRGGWTGSLNRLVRREIGDHFRDNPAARRARYPHIIRSLHFVFDRGSLCRFIVLYLLLLSAIASAEVIATMFVPGWLPRWTGANEIKGQLTNVASYLMSTQVGVLGVLSIAVGLVTLIAQRPNTSTDVRVYYHESLAFGVVASSIALLAVLCAQLFWPLQFGMHWMGYGTGLQVFKLFLTAVHILWLLLNLAGLAHFVATTLAFVQQSARETMRERYTANVVQPLEMRDRLRKQLYLAAGPDMVQAFWSRGTPHHNDPTIYLGQDFSRAGEIEVVLGPSDRWALRDVRINWVRWVVKRWLERYRDAVARGNIRPRGGLASEALLLFPPRLDEPIADGAGLCRRRGGVPFMWYERLVLRFSFKFGRMRDAA